MLGLNYLRVKVFVDRCARRANVDCKQMKQNDKKPYGVGQVSEF